MVGLAKGRADFGKKNCIHMCCWCSHGMLVCVQVTAYSVIKSNGQTGTLPTGVNFQIGSGSNQSLPSFASGSSAVSPLVVQHDHSCCLL